MKFVIPDVDLSKMECPLAVIRCSDWRLRQSDQEFIEQGLGFKDFDLYSWPHSEQEILKDNGFKKSFVEKLIAFSRNKHAIKKLLLLCHVNGKGEDQLVEDLRKVKDIIAETIPDDLEIIMAYSRQSPQGAEYIVVE